MTNQFATLDADTRANIIAMITECGDADINDLARMIVDNMSPDELTRAAVEANELIATIRLE